MYIFNIVHANTLTPEDLSRSVSMSGHIVNGMLSLLLIAGFLVLFALYFQKPGQKELKILSFLEENISRILARLSRKKQKKKPSVQGSGKGGSFRIE